jgi:hypothetical protein
MSLRIQNSRQLLKRTNVSGATPTVNTGSTQHTDGTWTVDEIYAGELYWNMQDIPKKLYLGWEDISGNTGVELIYPQTGTPGPSFTGGSGNCITDFYVTNIFGCSPITIHDDTIFSGSTELGRIEEGVLGQEWLLDTTVNTLLLKSPDTINLQATTDAVFTLNPSLTTLQMTDGTNYDNSFNFDTTEMLFKAEDITGSTQSNLELRHNLTYFAHFNSGDLSFIQAQDSTIDIQTQTPGGTLHQVFMDSTGDAMNITTTASGGEFASIDLAYDSGNNETSILLRAEDNSFVEVSSINMTKELITLFSSTDTTLISASSIVGVGTNAVTLTAAREVFKVTPDNLIHTTTDIVVAGTNAIFYHIEKLTTTGVTPTTLFSIPFTQSGHVITIKAIVNGSDSTGGEFYGAEYFGVFKNVAGTVTRISTLDKSEKTDFSTATTDIVISGTNIIIQVTGEAATTIKWVTRFNYTIS